MTAGALAVAAVANREKRLAQLAALQGVGKQARERAREMRGQVQQAKKLGAAAAVTRGFRHIPGFFPSPPPVVERLLELAQLYHAGADPLHVLEPNCGKGNVAHAVARLGHKVYCVEVMQSLASHCEGEGLWVHRADFLALRLKDFAFAVGVGGFDRVVMNPPFEKRQDEAHIRHAFEFLRPGGILAAVCSSMTALRMADWVREHDGESEPLPPNSFKFSENPTGVFTSIITIRKP